MEKGKHEGGRETAWWDEMYNMIVWFWYGDRDQPGLRLRIRSGDLSEANQAKKFVVGAGRGRFCTQLVLNVIIFA